MATLQELERPIDEAVVNGLIAATPEWWKAAVLEITRTAGPNKVEGFAHVVTSPEGHREIVQATEDVFAATLQLANLFAAFGRQWKKVVYSIQQTPEGAWR